MRPPKREAKRETAIIPAPKPLGPSGLTNWTPEQEAKARRFSIPTAAKNTKLAYTSDLKAFTVWCEAHGVVLAWTDHGTLAQPVTPEVLVSYMTDLTSRLKASSISQHVAAIVKLHELSGLPSPRVGVVKAALTNIRREMGMHPGKKRALTIEHLRAMLDTLPNDLMGLRDRAILLVGFVGAFRRSELAAVRMEHLQSSQSGLAILVPWSKTDQEGMGLTKAIVANEEDFSLCPVRALKRYVEAAHIKDGFLFRSFDVNRRMKGERGIDGRAIYDLIKKALKSVGIAEADFGAHSLRAGFVTTAALNGAALHTIMRQTGHTKEETVLGYIRAEDPAAGNAAVDIWKGKKT